MNRFVAMVLCVVCACGSVVGADVLEPMAGPAVEGFFLSYDKGKINFMNKAQKTLHEPPGSVKKLTLDKPLKATMESKMKRGERGDVMVSGFEQGSFLIERDGKYEKIAVFNLAALRVDSLANNRTMDQLGDQAGVISNGEEVNLQEEVEKGKVTIVQFHLPGAVASEREGNYLETLERRNTGKLVVKRIVVTNANAPVAKQYQVTTLPQFWFYDKNSQLAVKLTERFTETDINEALKKASK